MAKTFAPKGRSKKSIEFAIDNDQTGEPDEFTFKPSKLADVLLPALDGGSSEDDGQTDMSEGMWGWLREGLSEDDYGKIVERLRDPNDHLDVGDIFDVTRWLIGQASGRPTRSRRN